MNIFLHFSNSVFCQRNSSNSNINISSVVSNVLISHFSSYTVMEVQVLLETCLNKGQKIISYERTLFGGSPPIRYFKHHPSIFIKFCRTLNGCLHMNRSISYYFTNVIRISNSDSGKCNSSVFIYFVNENDLYYVRIRGCNWMYMFACSIRFVADGLRTEEL